MSPMIKHTIVHDLTISPPYKIVKDKLDNFSLNSFCDQRKVDEYVEAFSLRTLCRKLEADRIASKNTVLDRTISAF
jgi:hypothetical protein